MAMLAALTAIGLVILLPFAWHELASGAVLHPVPAAFAGIAYTGIFPAFLGYVFYNRAVAEVGAAKGGLFIHLMPVFSTILAAIFLGEVPQLYHLLGVVMILAGIWLTTGFNRR